MMQETQALCSRVYYDCAASPLLYDTRIYRCARLLGLHQKILFGSDFPLLPIARYLRDIAGASFDEAETALLLGDNASAVLHRSFAPVCR
jgi:predicted TIM-barrel fold metal-dependent hydrolase